MAKAAPSKKTAKTAKAAATTSAGGEGGKKKKRHHARVETYNTYIYKVLKQVHPGESVAGVALLTDQAAGPGSECATHPVRYYRASQAPSPAPLRIASPHPAPVQRLACPRRACPS